MVGSAGLGAGSPHSQSRHWHEAGSADLPGRPDFGWQHGACFPGFPAQQGAVAWARSQQEESFGASREDRGCGAEVGHAQA
jgi:hypothetical protein